MDIADLLFSFAGRINRGKFWLGFLILTVLSIIAYLAIVVFLGEPFAIANLEAVANGAEPEIVTSTPGLIGYAIMSLISIFMSFAIMIKRCHDRGKPGWWSLIALIPIAGSIWAIIDLGVMEGDPGPNQYGPNPLQV